MTKHSFYHQIWNAEEYDYDRFGEAFGHFLESQEVETYLALIDGSYKSILDVGAGTGKLSLPLIQQSRYVVSMDASHQMIWIAECKAQEKGLLMNSLVVDLHNMSFRDNAFDCVVSSRVLMLATDWRAGIAEMCRVSQKAVILDFPPTVSFSSLGSLVTRIQGLFAKSRKTYKAFSINGVVKELEENNFRITYLQRRYFLPIVIHRILDRPRLSTRLERLCEMFGLVKLMGAPVTIKAVKERQG